MFSLFCYGLGWEEISRFESSDVFDLLFIFPYVSCFQLVGCG